MTLCSVVADGDAAGSAANTNAATPITATALNGTMIFFMANVIPRRISPYLFQVKPAVRNKAVANVRTKRRLFRFFLFRLLRCEPFRLSPPRRPFPHIISATIVSHLLREISGLSHSGKQRFFLSHGVNLNAFD